MEQAEAFSKITRMPLEMEAVVRSNIQSCLCDIVELIAGTTVATLK